MSEHLHIVSKLGLDLLADGGNAWFSKKFEAPSNLLEQRLDIILQNLCLLDFMAILSGCFGNSLDNLRSECVINPDLELVEVFKDE